MKPLPHTYAIALTGASAGYATLSGAGLPDLTAAPPLEYDGPGDAWSPEHLLLAAVSSCFLFTFRAVAHASKLEFLTVDADVSGTVAKADGVIRFTDIVVRPTVTTNSEDTAAVQRAIDQTASRCLVSSSLAIPVRLEATIRSNGRRAAA